MKLQNNKLSATALLILLSTIPFNMAFGGKQDTPRQFEFRYFCLVATPKRPSADKLVNSRSKQPKVFEELQDGLRMPVAETDKTFLSKIGKQDLGYTFRQVFSGKTLLNENQEVEIKVAPVKDDPIGIALTDRVSIEQTLSEAVTVRQTGLLSYSGGQGSLNRQASGWQDSIREETALGKTYSMGINNLPNGSRVVYAYTILKRGNGDSNRVKGTSR